jgi:hypothetical protein
MKNSVLYYLDVCKTTCVCCLMMLFIVMFARCVAEDQNCHSFRACRNDQQIQQPIGSSIHLHHEKRDTSASCNKMRLGYVHIISFTLLFTACFLHYYMVLMCCCLQHKYCCCCCPMYISRAIIPYAVVVATCPPYYPHCAATALVASIIAVSASLLYTNAAPLLRFIRTEMRKDISSCSCNAKNISED